MSKQKGSVTESAAYNTK